MSGRVRTAFVIGCLGVAALHLPGAFASARAGLRGPYPELAPPGNAQSEGGGDLAREEGNGKTGGEAVGM